MEPRHSRFRDVFHGVTLVEIAVVAILVVALGSFAVIRQRNKAIRETVERVGQDLRGLARAVDQAAYRYLYGHLVSPPQLVVPPPFELSKSEQQEFRRKYNETERFRRKMTRVTEADALQMQKDSPESLFVEAMLLNEKEDFYIMSAARMLPGVEEHLVDPFNRGHESYCYRTDFRRPLAYILSSSGPDGDRDINPDRFDPEPVNCGFDKPLLSYAYDPTNGLVSDGDIFVVGPVREGFTNRAEADPLWSPTVPLDPKLRKQEGDAK